VVEAEGELGPFRTFRRQPAQRERGLHQQLHRFLGTGSGRKIRYARLLVGRAGPRERPRAAGPAARACLRRRRPASTVSHRDRAATDRRSSANASATNRPAEPVGI
jgi:hypothetical protein